MAKKKHTINKSLFIVPIISAMLLIWYYTTNSVFEKIFIIFVLFSTVLPLGFGMMNIMILLQLHLMMSGSRAWVRVKNLHLSQCKQIIN